MKFRSKLDMKKTMKSLRIVLTSLVLMLPILAAAKHRNAFHFFVSDNLIDRGDSEVINGNTRYTPDFDLSSPSILDPWFNSLQGTLLDEIFLKITFKPGITPSIKD